MRASKRQQVVDKAGELFSLHGFHPVGIDRIIAEADVARMTLYHHFAGKDDLIKAVLEQRYTFIMESIAAKLDPMPHAAAPEGIFDWYGTGSAARRSRAACSACAGRVRRDLPQGDRRGGALSGRLAGPHGATARRDRSASPGTAAGRRVRDVTERGDRGCACDRGFAGCRKAWQAAEMLLNESRVAAESTRKARSRRA